VSRRISELAEVEFEGSLSEAFAEYSRRAEKLALALSFELEMAESDSRAAMSRLSGHLLLFGVDVKVRARRVAKRLRRARELADGIAAEASLFERNYRRYFLGQWRRWTPKEPDL
jgi:hypothetical protein